MSNTVIFAEKPSQAKAYAEAFSIKDKSKTHIQLQSCSTFPKGAIITWGIGHLVELQQPGEYHEKWGKWNLTDLPILPDNFQDAVSKDKKAQFAAVKKYFQQADLIINGCDIDREGSNIFQSTFFLTGVKGKEVKRLWINSLEKEEVLKGFNNLQPIEKDLRMYQEAKARQISDWLVGINLSRAYTLHLQKRGYKGNGSKGSSAMSVGRVQSPALYLIYQRQQEIEHFKPEPFFELEGNFKAANGSYKGMAKIKEKQKETVSALLEKEGLLPGEVTEGTVQNVEKKEKQQQAPKLHSLSSLQSTANKRWKYSPSDVLKTMQELYLKKLVTYPRTDCNFITENEFAYIRQNVKAYQQLLKVEFEPATLEAKKRYVDGSKVEEHFALVPTKNVPNQSTIQNLSQMEKNLYNEVLATTLGMFHRPYLYEETKIITNVKNIEFFTTGKVEKDKGWKALYAAPKKEDKEEQAAVLPAVTKAESVESTVTIKEGMTKPPKPYTEGQLINMMKTCGKLIDDEEDIEILKEVEGIGTEATRSGIIETIKAQRYIEVQKNIVTVTPKGSVLCEAIEGTLLSSPSMTAKWEAYLQKIGKGEGSKDAFIQKTKEFVTKMVGETSQRVDQTNIENVIQEEAASNQLAACPACKSGSIQDRKTFFGCSGYREGCTFTLPKKIAGKSLTTNQIKMLCEKGKTNKIKGFTSKKKKSFEAALKLDDQRKIAFDFPKK
ncbi:DNA topoisomerase III [Bacillus luteus]|uniref:DNA topoisomerase n=2 Tax=Alkalicoccus luteus TaxID=1237094 RepID=A0A969TUQ7_9BACI|nr:type IA DNA topoisomerase [Alkalicoccus luteus]NJP38963.1 DNA topoisomerase III [Alkalicoccus luteus]